MKLLDTSFLIDLLAGVPAAGRKAKALHAEGALVGVPAPCVAELLRGVLRGGGKGLDAAEALLGELEVAPLDESSARRAGQLAAETSARGLEVAMVDALIAGIALEVDGEIVSRDSDFHRIPGLRLETY